MADCELLNNCIFFNDKMHTEKGLGALYKKIYCQGDKSRCARYLIATKLGKDKVPANLYPNMNDKADEIISKG